LPRSLQHMRGICATWFSSWDGFFCTKLRGRFCKFFFLAKLMQILSLSSLAHDCSEVFENRKKKKEKKIHPFYYRWLWYIFLIVNQSLF
jgi:hypothetical protein